MSEFGGGNVLGFWSDARIEILRTMSDEGKSNAAIAAVLGCGCTRNMVNGKRKRMKFKANAPRQRVDLKGMERRPAAVAQPEAPRAPVITEEPEAIGPIEDFSDGCQWIHGHTNEKGWRMCGQPADKQRLCEYHHRRSLAPKGKKPAPEQQYAETTRQAVMARTGLG